MIIKNFSRMKTNEIMKLANFVIQHYPGLDHAGVEVHVKQYNGRGVLGLAYPTTNRAEISKREQHYFKEIEPTSKQLALVYIRKNLKKWKKSDVITWQEDFIATLTHELRHLWHFRHKQGLEEEEDCNRMETIAIKKYRKLCNALSEQCLISSNIDQSVQTIQGLEQ
jgi:hypothetical protein